MRSEKWKTINDKWKIKINMEIKVKVKVKNDLKNQKLKKNE